MSRQFVGSADIWWRCELALQRARLLVPARNRGRGRHRHGADQAGPVRNRAPQSHEWLDAATQRLRVLWAEGLGTREIGAELGVGKNAVIGKARRLGLAPRPSPLGVHPGQPLPPPRPRLVLYRPPVVRKLQPQQLASLAGRPPAPPATPPTPPQPPPAPPTGLGRTERGVHSSATRRLVRPSAQPAGYGPRSR